MSESGAAEYRIPIKVPPGIAGMEPKLALSYNSQAGNGLLGVGWNLEGLSAITRCPKTLAQEGVRGAVNYNWNDRYCLDGQRLIEISGAYGGEGTEYRAERESFSKVISYGAAGDGPAWFKVWTKSGQILEYGNTLESRVEAQGKPTVRVWAINKIQDTKGNYLEVSYFEDVANGEYYPARIDYSGNAGAGAVPASSVRISYEQRADAIPANLAGSTVVRRYRAALVKTYVGNAPVRSYRLAYGMSVDSQRSRLTSVTECSGDESSCLPATMLGYDLNPMALVANGPFASPVDRNFTAMVRPDDSVSPGGTRFVDLNGDGLVDMITLVYDSPGGWWGTGGWYRMAWLNTGSGWAEAPQYVPPGDRDFTAMVRGDDVVFPGVTRFVDLNGDGLVDMITLAYSDSNTWWPSGGWYRNAWLNTGNGWVQAPQYVPPGDREFTAMVRADNSVSSGGTEFVDLNGDGLVDMITLVYDSPGGWWGTGGWYRMAWLNTGSGWAEAPQYVPPGDRDFTAMVRGDDVVFPGVTRFVDLNGDGLVDMITLAYSDSNTWWPSGGWYRNAWLNTGNGWVQAPQYVPPGDREFTAMVRADNSVSSGGTEFVDLNGDGLVDMITLVYDSPGGWWGTGGWYRMAWLNTGSGWAEAPQYVPPGDRDFTAMVRGDDVVFPGVTRFVDLNGDGLVDMITLAYSDSNTWWPSGGWYRNAWLNTGRGWVQAPQYVPPGDREFTAMVRADNSVSSGGTEFVDLNGDGLADMVTLVHDSPGGWWDNGAWYRGAWLTSAPSDRLVSIQNGIAQSIDVAYTPLTNARVYTKDLTAIYPQINIQGPLFVVASTSVSNGIGATRDESYLYGGAKSELTGRGFLGFRWLESIDQQTGVKSRTEFRQDWPYVGLPSLVRKAQRSDALLSQGMNIYGCTNPESGLACTVEAGNRYFPFLSQSVESSNDLSGAMLPTVTTTTQYDGNGNATSVVVSTDNDYSKSTTNTYANDAANIGRLKRSATTSTSP